MPLKASKKKKLSWQGNWNSLISFAHKSQDLCPTLLIISNFKIFFFFKWDFRSIAAIILGVCSIPRNWYSAAAAWENWPPRSVRVLGCRFDLEFIPSIDRKAIISRFAITVYLSRWNYSPPLAETKEEENTVRCRDLSKWKRCREA